MLYKSWFSLQLHFWFYITQTWKQWEWFQTQTLRGHACSLHPLALMPSLWDEQAPASPLVLEIVPQSQRQELPSPAADAWTITIYGCVSSSCFQAVSSPRIISWHKLKQAEEASWRSCSEHLKLSIHSRFDDRHRVPHLSEASASVTVLAQWAMRNRKGRSWGKMV